MPKITPHHLVLGLLFGILALIVLSQANPGTEIPGRDSGSYLYIARQIVLGRLPYQDVWDSKPPAIFYLNALALRIGRGSRWGLWLVEFAFLFGSIAVSHRVMKRLWGDGSALFGLMTWLLGLNQVLEGGNFTEEYPLILHFISLMLFLLLIDRPRSRLFTYLLGLMFAGSFLFRPNNAVLEVIVILAVLIMRIAQRDFRTLLNSAGMIALGFLTPMVITAAYFWDRGLLWDMFEASILYNLLYGSTRMTSSSTLLTGFLYLGPAAWIGLGGYILAIFRLRKLHGTPSFYVLLLLLGGFPLAIFLTDPARRNYAHYYINWMPFIAMSSGFVWYSLRGMFSSSVTGIRPPPALPHAVALVIAGTVLLAGGSAAQYQKALDRKLNGPFAEMRSSISLYVENHTRPGETVLFWASLPGENFMSRRDAPHSSLFYPSYVESDISDRLSGDFLKDITADPPVLVVDMGRLEPLSLDPGERAVQRSRGIGWPYPPKNLEDVFAFFEENYYLEADIGGKIVYRLRGTSQP